MPLLKRLGEAEATRSILCHVGAAYIRLIERTTRWRIVGQERVKALYESGTPLVVCFWHGRLLLTRVGWPWRDRILVLVSQHRDGRVIAGTVERLGVRTIAGSTRRGGAQALRDMVLALRAGDHVAITPDGPRGPRMRAAPGAVALARMAGATLVPVAWSTTRGKLLGSWDRFLLPYPFGCGVYRFGEPLAVPRDADSSALAALSLELERRLNATTEAADRDCGRPAVAPALVET